MGAASGMGRIAGMISPLVATTIGEEDRSLAMGIYGMVGLCGLIATCFMPVETMGAPLADHVGGVAATEMTNVGGPKREEKLSLVSSSALASDAGQSSL